MKARKSLLNVFLVMGLVGTIGSAKAITRLNEMDVLSHSSTYGWVRQTSGSHGTYGIVDVTNNLNEPVYCIDKDRDYPGHDKGKAHYICSGTYTNSGVACVFLNYAKNHNYQLPNSSVYSGDLSAASSFDIGNSFAELQSYIWDNIDVDAPTCGPIKNTKAGVTITDLKLPQPTKFEYNKDLGEYVSQKITVTHTGDYTISLTNAPTGSYVSNSATSKEALTTTNSNELYVHIKAAETDNISAKLEISQTYVGYNESHSAECSTYEFQHYSNGATENPTLVQRLAKCEIKNTATDEVKKASVNLSYNPEAPEPSKVVIKKTDATTGKELEGATLRILDKDKKEISCVIRKSDGKEQTLEKCTWVSGKSSTTVVGLNAGNYYLEETIAPKGYVKSSKMVPFTVKADGSTTPVEMKNEVEEVVVPDTLGKRSALLLTIAMFDIALGIGVLTYVKKNKVQE